MENSPYNYIDIAKGLGMLAVVWGHVRTSGMLFLFVYSFDIPLFFFMAGMMFKNDKYDSLGKLLKSRARTLLKPYVLFSLATWLFWLIYCRLVGFEADYLYSLLQTVYAQGTYEYLAHDFPMWFVTALFVVEVLYYFISKLPDIWNILICAACAAVGYFMRHNSLDIDLTVLPWNIDSAMPAMLFYCLGNLFVKKHGVSAVPEWVKSNRRKAVILAVLLAIAVFFASQFNGPVSLASNHFGKNMVLMYVIGMAGVASALMFSGLMELAAAGFTGAAARFLKRIGRSSFYYMAVHEPAREYIVMVFAFVLTRVFNMPASPYAIGSENWKYALIYIADIVLTMAIVELINLGKRKLGEKRQRAQSAE